MLASRSSAAGMPGRQRGPRAIPARRSSAQAAPMSARPIAPDPPAVTCALSGLTSDAPARVVVQSEVLTKLALDVRPGTDSDDDFVMQWLLVKVWLKIRRPDMKRCNAWRATTLPCFQPSAGSPSRPGQDHAWASHARAQPSIGIRLGLRGSR